MRQRIVVVVDLDIPDEYGENWWQSDAPLWIESRLAEDIGISDLTVYQNVSDLVADVEEQKDMFRMHRRSYT